MVAILPLLPQTLFSGASTFLSGALDIQGENEQKLAAERLRDQKTLQENINAYHQRNLDADAHNVNAQNFLTARGRKDTGIDLNLKAKFGELAMAQQGVIGKSLGSKATAIGGTGASAARARNFSLNGQEIAAIERMGDDAYKSAVLGKEANYYSAKDAIKSDHYNKGLNRSRLNIAYGPRAEMESIYNTENLLNTGAAMGKTFIAGAATQNQAAGGSFWTELNSFINPTG